MAGDAHGDKTQEEPQVSQDDGQQQTPQEQPQVSGMDWEKAIAERDGRIAELEAQVADAARNAEAAEALRSEITELRQASADERIDFKLQLAGCRNVKAARAILDDHEGDIDKLKQAEPWLFAKHLSQEGASGTTGLPQRRCCLRRGQDDEALAKARRAGRYQREGIGGPTHG